NVAVAFPVASVVAVVGVRVPAEVVKSSVTFANGLLLLSRAKAAMVTFPPPAPAIDVGFAVSVRVLTVAGVTVSVISAVQPRASRIRIVSSAGTAGFASVNRMVQLALLESHVVWAEVNTPGKVLVTVKYGTPSGVSSGTPSLTST